MEFGEKLKYLRKQNEYSQEELAELINVSRQAITKWENNNGMPDIENLKVLAKTFDVTIDSLVFEEEEVETIEDSFIWKFAEIGGIIGLVIGFLLMDFVGAKMIFLGVGGAIISGAIGYGILYSKKL